MGRVFFWMALMGSASLASAGEGQQISTDDVKAIVEVLASDEMGGRSSREEGGRAAREWLKSWLHREGFFPAGEIAGSFEQPFDEGVNLLALSRPLLSEAPKLILSAHYDHKGVACRSHPLALSPVCNGATDNAAGVALVLLVAKTLKAETDVPFAVTLWDAEELGLKGSRYFSHRPSFPVTSLRLLINFDIVGLNLFKGFEDHHFMIGAETGGKELMADAAAAREKASMTYLDATYAFGHLRSDMSSFYLAGYELPFVFFSDGDGGVYHTTADEAVNVNYKKVADVGEVARRLARRALGRADSYSYVKPELTQGLVLPRYVDVHPILKAVDAAIAHAFENRISGEDVALLQESSKKLRQLKAAGKESFGMQDAAALAKIAQDLLNLSASLPVIP